MHYSAYQTTQNDDIKRLFTRTFADSEGEAEGALIGKLAAELLTTTPQPELRCFIATDSDNEGPISGAIIFTRLHFEPGDGESGNGEAAGEQTAFLLSPVAVGTAHQGQGIGQALISFGLEQLRAEGATLAVTYGDPKFYSRLGFASVTEETIKAPQPLSYPHGWLARSLIVSDQPLQPVAGGTRCAAALNKPDYW